MHRWSFSKILDDKGCDRDLVGALRNAGYDVLYALESEPGATNDVALALAFVERRIILTEDKDFGELVYRLKSLPMESFYCVLV